MTPLGLAELTNVRDWVAARLLHRQAGRVVLGDALRRLELRDATGGGDGCQEGQFVQASVSTEPSNGEAVCWSLRPLGDGRPTEPRPARYLLLRHAALATIRSYFAAERFLEVHTPTFGVCPGLDPHVHALGTARGQAGPEHCVTSPEFYMKRLLAEGVPRLFQLAPVFRAEELGPWHEPEFTLLEWYRAYEGLEGVLCDTEQLVRLVGDALAEGGLPSGNPLRLQPPFARLTVREAFQKYAGVTDSSDYAASDPAGYFQTFVDQVEPGLARIEGPVFLTEFPASQAALARLSPRDPSVALRFELLLDGVELCNGYDELTDPKEQRARFTAELERRRLAAEPVYPLDERFLAALEAGMPPAAGNALGVERLLAVLCGTPGIAPYYAFTAAEH